jgi:hypothetical protein
MGGWSDKAKAREHRAIRDTAQQLARLFLADEDDIFHGRH